MRVTAGGESGKKALLIALHGAGGSAADGLRAFGSGWGVPGVALVAPASRGTTWSILRGPDTDLDSVNFALHASALPLLDRPRPDRDRRVLGRGDIRALPRALERRPLSRGRRAVPGRRRRRRAAGKAAHLRLSRGERRDPAHLADERPDRAGPSRSRLRRHLSEVPGRSRGTRRPCRGRRCGGSSAGRPRPSGGARARARQVVPTPRPRPPLAPYPRPVRDPRQRGDAPADAGRARRPAVPRLARALADRRGARDGADGERDPRVAGLGYNRRALDPPSGRAVRGRLRLARRPHGAAGRGPVHGRRTPPLRLGRGRPPARRERRSRATTGRARRSRPPPLRR